MPPRRDKRFSAPSGTYYAERARKRPPSRRVPNRGGSKQSSFANVRKMVSGTRAGQEAAAADRKRARYALDLPGGPTRENAARLAPSQNQSIGVTAASIRTATSNPTAPTRANAARLGTTDTGSQFVDVGGSVSFRDPRSMSPGEKADFALSVFPAGKTIKGAQVLSRAGRIISTPVTRAAGHLSRKAARQAGIGQTSSVATATTSAGTIPINSKTYKVILDWTKNFAKERWPFVVKGGQTYFQFEKAKNLIPSKTVAAMIIGHFSASGMARWLGEAENSDSVNMAMRDLRQEAYWSDDPERANALLDELDDLQAVYQEVVLNTEDDYKDWFGIYGLWTRVEQRRQLNNAVFHANAMLNEDVRAKVNGATDEEILAAREIEQEFDLEQTLADSREYQAWVNEQKIKTQQQIIEMNEYANTRRLSQNLAAEKRRLALQAAYWEEQQRRAIEWEKEKLALQQAYWDEYYRRQAEERAKAAPSRLNFGLL